MAFYDKQDYLLAYEYFNALDKALKRNYKDDIVFIYKVITKICLDMSEYSKAYHFYELSLKNLFDNKYLEGEIKLILFQNYVNSTN